MRKLWFLIGAAVLAQNAWPPPGMQCPQRTVAVFERGPNWEKRQGVSPQHFDYMLKLMKSGKVLSAGPMADGQTAMILFATKEWTEVQDLLRDEPYTRAGVLALTHHNVWNACEAAR